MSSVTRTILIILLLSFIIRLTGITNPPLERSHNWRQSFTAMVARNFDRADIMHPTVDYDGGSRVAMEFPLYTYSIHLLNSIFGESHWYGRLINLIVTCIGTFFFFRLIALIYGERHAFFATLVLTFSIFFAFGRKIMPDTFSVSLTIIGIYFAASYVIRTNTAIWRMIIAAVFIGLGFLSKIPSLTVVTLLIPAIILGTDRNRKFHAVFFVILPALIVAYIWYGIVVPMQLHDGARPLYFPTPFKEGLELLSNNWLGVFEKFYFSAFYSFIAFGFFIAGLFMIRGDRSKIIFFVITAFVFAVFMIKAAYFFHYHNYYVIPFVPCMAFIGGYALKLASEKSKILVMIICAGFIIESVLNQQHDFFIPANEKYKAELSGLLDLNVPSNEKILINSGPNPQQLYFADRKGWLWNESMNADSAVAALKDSITIIVLDKRSPIPEQWKKLKLVAENENYMLVR